MYKLLFLVFYIRRGLKKGRLVVAPKKSLLGISSSGVFLPKDPGLGRGQPLVGALEPLK